MLKKVLLIILCYTNLFAISIMEEFTWQNGETLLSLLEKNSISLKLYYNLDKADQEMAAEIANGSKYQILKNHKNEIEQILIPINGSDLQIHIYKNSKDQYDISFTPIKYNKSNKIMRLNINKSAYEDIYKESSSATLARAAIKSFKNSVDFKKMRKGNEIILYYERKERLGKLFGDIIIKYAKVEVNKQIHKIILFDNSYFDENGKEVDSFLLTNPIDNARISSYFTTGRYHPILKRYRAHLGVDYASKKGTPVKSAGNGIISFVGQKNGYGNTVQIKHNSGYNTLYAHLNNFANIKVGQKISQGQIIGYVGSTGLSTGPHLHFGLYQNNKAIDPLSVIKIAKVSLKNKDKIDFNNLIKKYENIINKALNQDFINPPKEENFDNFIEFNLN